MRKTPLAHFAPSSHDPTTGSAKVKVGAVGIAAIVLLEQFTDLPHDSVMAAGQIIAILLGAMGVRDGVAAYVNGKPKSEEVTEE